MWAFLLICPNVGQKRNKSGSLKISQCSSMKKQAKLYITDDQEGSFSECDI